MARLQDFSTVTPTANDNLLIVQSQGQGLASINSVINKPRQNITSSVTFNETITGTSTQIFVKDNVLYIFYQGESKAHSANDLLFTLPSAYRPSMIKYVTFLASNGVNFITGDVYINTDGTCKVNQISNTSGAGRIYFTFAYPLS